jgi:hypothetical protein
MEYVAVDQFGMVFKLKTCHPRKELKTLFSGRVSKMYVDLKSGETKHIGYIVGGSWLTLYKTIRFEGVEA